LEKFISEDPAQDGTSWYRYESDRPLGTLDPTGLQDNDTPFFWMTPQKKPADVITRNIFQGFLDLNPPYPRNALSGGAQGVDWMDVYFPMPQLGAREITPGDALKVVPKALGKSVGELYGEMGLSASDKERLRQNAELAGVFAVVAVVGVAYAERSVIRAELPSFSTSFPLYKFEVQKNCAAILEKSNEKLGTAFDFTPHPALAHLYFEPTVRIVNNPNGMSMGVGPSVSMGARVSWENVWTTDISWFRQRIVTGVIAEVNNAFTIGPKQAEMDWSAKAYVGFPLGK
jgi:hypothetical protein